MSNISVQTVNKWSPKDVIAFLESEKDALFLNNDDIEAFKKNRVAGYDFLLLTKYKLIF